MRNASKLGDNIRLSSRSVWWTAITLYCNINCYRDRRLSRQPSNLDIKKEPYYKTHTLLTAATHLHYWQQQHTYITDSSNTLTLLTAATHLHYCQQQHTYITDSSNTLTLLPAATHLHYWQQQHTYITASSNTLTLKTAATHWHYQKWQRIN